MKPHSRFALSLNSTIALVGILLFSPRVEAAESPTPRPLPFAHSHNDYEHDRPLLDALEQGFCSVEADVWLVDDRLLVAHDRDKVDPKLTLETLYLNPLKERVDRNGGSVFPGLATFYLMIDFKSESTNTYAALQRTLKNHAPILTQFHSNRTETNAITVVISGDRPREWMQAESGRLAGYDGRLTDLDLDQPLSPHFAPWISDNWRRVFTWDGSGAMPDHERRQLADLAIRTHRQGKKLRLWAAPDVPAVWEELLRANVDLINTDKLPEFQSFATRWLKQSR